MYAAQHHFRVSSFPVSNDNHSLPALSSFGNDRLMADDVLGASNGCVFNLGGVMYFVPTQPIAGEGRLFITCDAQRIDVLSDGRRSHLALGGRADASIEQIILDHLCALYEGQPCGDSFVVTSWGKTFRL